MGVYFDSLFIQILNMSITAGYCIAAVFAVRFFLRRAPRKYLYVLWAVVAFRLICPVSISTDFSFFNLERFEKSIPYEHTGAMEYIPGQVNQTEHSNIHTSMTWSDRLANEQLPRTSAFRFKGISLKNLLYSGGSYKEPVLLALSAGKYIWILGMFVFLVYFLCSTRKLKEKVRMAVLAELCQGTVPIYECDGLDSPFVMGMIHPRIYLPWGLESGARELILLHEKYHIKRKDYLVKPLAFFLLAVYWFHPLVWAAWFGMCRDMELSCDEKVLEQSGEGRKKEYSMALLSFAVQGCSGGRIPPAFGEQDVKGRIRHALRFKKPALWAGILAVIIIAAVLAVLGTNGTGKKPVEESKLSESAQDTGAEGKYSEAAGTLYEARNPYVGDASANGRLLNAITSVMPDSALAKYSFKTQLQTSVEPYEFHFLLEEDGESTQFNRMEENKLYQSMQTVSALMLALTDNLGEVHWHYTTAYSDDDDPFTFHEIDASQNIESTENWCGIEDIKACGESLEGVQTLLEILSALEKAPEEAADEAFMQWYDTLPSELYTQAALEGEAEDEAKDAHLFLLGRTEDEKASVYGCYSKSYGERGVTVSYRPDVNSEPVFTPFDLYWISENPCCQIAAADYDRDGEEEVALVLLEWMSLNEHRERLIVLEPSDEGQMIPCEFTDEMRKAEIETLVAATDDEVNHMVHFLDRTNPASSVPVLSIPYGDSTENVYEYASLNDQVHFQIKDSLIMQIEPAIRLKGWPANRFFPQASGEDSLLTFSVTYDWSASLGSGYFALQLVRAD